MELHESVEPRKNLSFSMEEKVWFDLRNNDRKTKIQNNNKHMGNMLLWPFVVSSFAYGRN